MITSEQIRGARAMLRIEQADLAHAARVSLETIKRIERKPGPISALAGTLEAIQKALEAGGVIFVEENGEGPGVRLRKVASAPQSEAALDRKIASQESAIADMPVLRGPSPEAGMATMDKALAQDNLVKLKNVRTRRKRSANDQQT